jgi:hypothetical protein
MVVKDQRQPKKSLDKCLSKYNNTVSEKAKPSARVGRKAHGSLFKHRGPQQSDSRAARGSGGFLFDRRCGSKGLFTVVGLGRATGWASLVV